MKTWAFKLDRVKGELTVQKIVDELYDWTARRMADAKENDSKADEMLLKRCAYHGLNFAAPFIVMRHWADIHQDGNATGPISIRTAIIGAESLRRTMWTGVSRSCW